MKLNATHITNILVATTLFCSIILTSTFVSADDVVDRVNITVPISCTMSGTGMNSHNADIINGTYQADIGTTVLHVFCNDSEGFAIFAAGYTGNEIGGTNSDKLIGANNNTVIITGTATSAGDPDISNWAMKLAIMQDSGNITGTNAVTIDNGFNSYHLVPNEYVKVAHKNSATDMTAATGGVKLTTTYATYVSKTQPADTYSGQVIYTLVHPSNHVAPVVCNPNGTTIGTNTSTDIVCMQDFASLNGYTKTALIGSMTSEVQYTLADKRDGKEYKIAKLADGNVWMTQNLDLDLDSTTTYTNLDTDLGWDDSTGSSQITSWSPERSTYATGSTTWGLYNQTTGEMDGFYHPESYDPGDLYWNGTISDWEDWGVYLDSCTFDSVTMSYLDCDESLNPISTYTTISGTPIMQYHLGNYYNWSAAIASNDSSNYGVYDDNTHTYINTETNQSICPAGWMLPIGGYFASDAPSRSIQYLLEQYGWNVNSGRLDSDRKVWESPIYFGLSGNLSGITLLDIGVSAYSWSSVTYSESGAYAFPSLQSGYIDPNYNNNRAAGNSVRCVARPPKTSFDEVFEDNNKTKVNNYYVIQDLDDSMCGDVSEGQVGTLVDTRDNTLYHVGKLADGNCWMLDNLALDPTNSTTASNMNANNTNASSSAITNLLNGGSTTTGWSSVAVADVDSGFVSYTEPMINNSNKDALVTGFGPVAVNGQSKVGIYYNYCAATAGTYCYDYDANSSGYRMITQDLCPAGWRMPTTRNGYELGEYYDLGYSLDISFYGEDGVFYGDRIMRYSSSLSNNLSGYYYDNSTVDQFLEGFWWSSVASFEGGTMRMQLRGYEVYPSFSIPRNHGATMRCILNHE